ncbi:hypothetical protein LCGC14_0343010 [marine sediment metagenome]|uniref:Uncharacterized protein n=1 Tax=marine sediment metagenome TaxID=412755 RepID=A0A0F9WKT2_9ZZZZ
MIKKSKFAERKHHQVMRKLRDELDGVFGSALNLPFIKGHTQCEEFVRKYIFAYGSRDQSRLPYVSDGIGSRSRIKAQCLGAELSCMITAIWRYDDTPTDPAMEEIRDLFEYFDQLVRDRDTIRVALMPLCRYRLVNNRIQNSNKMVEGKTDAELKAMADKYAAEDTDEIEDDTSSE